jgi:hypothetical protein
MKNQTVAMLSREYEEILRGLVGDYCLVKKNNPYAEFPTFAGAIWRYSMLVEMYATLRGRFKDMYLEG